MFYNTRHILQQCFPNQIFTNILSKGKISAACVHRGADKFLVRPISRCILFDGDNISFDASTNIPPIMIISRIYETQNLLSL
jgi:hypothetical protein